MGWVGVSSEMARLRAEVAKVEQQAVEEVKGAVRTVMRALLNNTVVWEGDVVRNYVWSRGGFGGGHTDPVGGRGTGSRQYRREVDPGPTGKLGAPPAGEVRRASNEAAAIADMESLLGTVSRLEDLFVTNTSPHADLVENGSAPTPGRARHPGGVSKLAAQQALASLKDFK